MQHALPRPKLSTAVEAKYLYYRSREGRTRKRCHGSVCGDFQHHGVLSSSVEASERCFLSPTPASCDSYHRSVRLPGRDRGSTKDLGRGTTGEQGASLKSPRSLRTLPRTCATGHDTYCQGHQHPRPRRWRPITQVVSLFLYNNVFPMLRVADHKQSRYRAYPRNKVYCSLFNIIPFRRAGFAQETMPHFRLAALRQHSTSRLNYTSPQI